MHLLARIGHPRYAQAFVDRLKSLGIQAKLDICEEGADVYLEDADSFSMAQQELALFQQNPDHERYREASWIVDHEVDESKTHQLSRFYQGVSLGNAIRQTGWVTKVVLLICTLVFLFTSQGMNDGARAPLMFFSSVDQIWSTADIWRWVTPAFIHFGIFHFAFNLSAWWIFGGLVERANSSLRLFSLFLVCAVISNWVQFIWVGDRFGGLSGVVYGVLGYLWFYQRFSPDPPFRLPQGLFVLMLVSLALGFTGVMNMANQAHLSGLLSGCFMGLVFARLDKAHTSI